MPLNNPTPGFGSVPEFMVSALPWTTSSYASTSPQRWDLPFVSKNVKIRNLDGSNPLAIGWTRNGVSGTNRFLVPAGASEEFDVRIKEIYVLGVSGSVEYSLYAGLTHIAARYMPLLSGTLGDGSPGWEGVG